MYPCNNYIFKKTLVKKCILVILIVSVTTLFFKADVHASTISEKNGVINIKTNYTKLEREIEHRRQVAEQCEKLGIGGISHSIFNNRGISTYNDISDYKTTYSAPVTKTFSGYAGNQSAGGYRFKTGGGFYYSDNGGPSCSLSIAFGGAYGSVNVSVPLGNNSSSGLYVAAPDKTHYFKLYIQKKYEVKSFIVYHKEYNYKTGKYEWKKYSQGTTKILLGTDVLARKV